MLVILVLARAYFVEEDRVDPLHSRAVLPLAISEEVYATRSNHVEELHQLAIVPTLLTRKADEDGPLAIVTTSDAARDSQEEFLVENTEDFTTGNSVAPGLEDESNGMPIELTLFTPMFDKKDPDADLLAAGDDDEDINVAPLDGGNTITNQMFKLFPRTSPF